MVPGRTGEGAARLSEHGWLGTQLSPALTLLTFSVISSLWVGLVSLSPTADGLLCGIGSLAAGDCGYRNPVLWPKGRGNCPLCQGNADWHRGNHILTCPKHTIPIRPCYPLRLQQKTKLAGLSQNACLSARYLAIFLRIHTTLQKPLWIPADRSPTQISSSQTWNLLLTKLIKAGVDFRHSWIQGVRLVQDVSH